MKKQYLLSLILFLPFQVMSSDNDSVYDWGTWAKGIKPAAGPAARVTPPPAQRPEINFRPNENSAFLRDAVKRTNIITGASDVDISTPIISTVAPPAAPPAAPGPAT